MMESDGKVTKAQRIEVVSTWIKHGENLPAGWQETYKQLFGEAPPDGQS
jgi:hypothetical protein